MTSPSQVRDAAASDEAWIIWFEDAGMPPETFTGYGAIEAARKRFDMVRSNWNCHLFRRVETDCGVEQTACLSGIASGEPCEPSAENLKRCRICGFIIDTNFAAEKPSVDFSMRGRGSGPVDPSQPPDGLMGAANIEGVARAIQNFDLSQEGRRPISDNDWYAVRQMRNGEVLKRARAALDAVQLKPPAIDGLDEDLARALEDAKVYVAIDCDGGSELRIRFEGPYSPERVHRARNADTALTAWRARNGEAK